jgi:hypothetical protein
VSAILRVYTRPEEIGGDGYPLAWHKCTACLGDGCEECGGEGSAKDLVRALAGHRCVRCGHPYPKGAGEWSPCDERCVHDSDQSVRVRPTPVGWGTVAELLASGHEVDSRWRILTVHHLTMDKSDLRWWNLASLCQRCHLQIQGKVQMARVYPWPHSEWFKPYAAGWYAWAYLGEELTRAETEGRLDELLALELAS